MKSIIYNTTAVLLLIGTLLSPAISHAKPIVLTALSALPTNHSSVRYLGIMADMVKERSSGELVINWVGGPEVTKAMEQAKAVQMGVIDILVSPAGYYEPVLPAAYAFNLSRYTPMEERRRGIYDLWVELHKRMNVRYLGMLYSGAQYYLYSKVPIVNPKQDFKGLKFRVAPTYAEMVHALGAVSVQVPTGEAYTAIERGMVEGTGSVHTTFWSDGLYEVCKYWIDHGLYRASCTALVNLNSWSRLPKHLQDMMLTTVAELEPQQNAFFTAEDAQLAKKFVEKGMKPITFAPDIAKWYVDLAYQSKWDKCKEKIDAEEYAKINKVLTK